jgi:anti-sigma factor RsiW
MPMNADCRHIRELMDSYLSGELTVESNHEVLRHLERCDSCPAELARRERTRALLIESFGIVPDAAPVEARIVRALEHEQDRTWRLARYGSIAAAVILMVGATVWLSRPVDAAAYDDSVDDHIVCALTYGPDAKYDAWRASQNLEPQFRAIVEAVPHQSGDYSLVDAHMCPYEGRNYAHLVYRDSGHALSVFAEAATRGRLPLTHESPRKGFVAAGESTGRHQVFVVTDHAASAPEGVVDELLQSTMKFVRGLER